MPACEGVVLMKIKYLQFTRGTSYNLSCSPSERNVFENIANYIHEVGLTKDWRIRRCLDEVAGIFEEECLDARDGFRGAGDSLENGVVLLSTIFRGQEETDNSMSVTEGASDGGTHPLPLMKVAALAEYEGLKLAVSAKI